jgi:hypothetical protein
VGIEATTTPIDATAMTHSHGCLVRWFYRFQSKLVDFGANGAFGGDDKEHE